jgi:hypothetical protein
MQTLNLLGSWMGDSVDQALWCWLCDVNMESFKELLLYFWWGLWIYKNRVFFENKPPNIVQVVTKIVALFKEVECKKKAQIQKDYTIPRPGDSWMGPARGMLLHVGLEWFST